MLSMRRPERLAAPLDRDRGPCRGAGGSASPGCPTEASHFVCAEEVFQGVTYTFEDDRFRYGEQRFVTLGLLRGSAVSLVHTEEGDHIHVISMRKATKRERKIYFQGIAN
jgi:uncharacterized DUF497 family protein